MNAPPPSDPQVTERIADTLEFGARVGIAVAAIWAFLMGVAKPYLSWRRVHRQGLIKEALKPELASLAQAITDGNECTKRVEHEMAVRAALFGDLDMLLDIALENSDRIDVTTAMLAERGLGRKGDAAQSDAMVDKLRQLSAQRRERRRAGET